MSQSSSSPMDPNPSAGPEDPSARRACDQCRMRKIRCNKETPCSNCSIARRSCTSNGTGQRPKEHRQRVLISSQYEKKIDHIEARLAGIESVLRDLAARGPSIEGPRFVAHTPQGPGNPLATDAATLDYESSDDEAAFTDEPILAAQRTFASDFLERAVQQTSLRDVNPKMKEALANLRQLVEMQNSQSNQQRPRFSLQKPLPPGGLSDLPLPPIETVVSILRHLRNAPPCLFTFLCYFVGVQDFSGLCRIVYFPSDDFTEATFIIVNACMYYMFLEQHAFSTEETQKRTFESYIFQCRSNLETALSSISPFMSAKVENLKALVLGSIYAVDQSKAAAAWSLNAMAVHLCLVGGFHRLDPSSMDTTYNIKTTLFWHVYTMDKALALRMGRAPKLQDWDITTRPEFHFEGPLSSEASGVPKMWIKLATLQGHIYEQLYSPAALTRPQEELVERARLLAEECRRVNGESAEARNKAVASLEKLKASHLLDIHVKGDEVQLLATMTLVYRAIPAPEGSTSRFGNECIETARNAMRKHQDCMSMVENEPFVKMIYVHWNLLLLPFSPFFVLFCYIIETSSLEDLQLLYEFTSTLEQAYFTSETAEKLWRLCNVMYSVAALYVEAKSQQQEDQDMIPIGDEFDMYLSQLGFIPADDHNAMLQPEAGGIVSGNPQAAQMVDWLSGSRNLMGLLEQDLSQFGSHSWPAPSSM